MRGFNRHQDFQQFLAVDEEPSATPPEPQPVYGYIKGPVTGRLYPITSPEAAADGQRRQLQAAMRRVMQPNGIDALTAFKARFVDYLFQQKAAGNPQTAAPTQSLEEVENEIRITPGAYLEKDRLHHRSGCWCGGSCPPR